MTDATTLITGANRGIGLEFCRQFAADGWRILACCRNPAQAAELQQLAARFEGIEVLELDVTDYAAVDALAARLRGRAIDILLSNAGIYGPRGKGFGQVEAAPWRDVFEVNTIAPMMLVQAFADHVGASERKLAAVVSSKMGSIDDNGSGGGYIYRSSKTAVNQVVKSLSLDLAGRGISVLTLHPGWVQTDMGGPNAETSVEDSVSGMRRILLAAGPAQSGQFFDFSGETINW